MEPAKPDDAATTPAPTPVPTAVTPPESAPAPGSESATDTSAAVPAPPAPAASGAAVATEAPAAQGEEQLGRRGERSPRDMAMSLVVLLIPIALVLIFYRVVLSGDAPASVDVAPTIQEAQQAKLFPIAVPRLSDDWHASSATWRKTAAGGTLRIGYVDPDKDPIQLIESNIDSQTLARTELTADAAQIDRYETGGRNWQLYTGRPGEQALVFFDEGRTILLVGKTKAENLEELAASLS